MSGAVLLVTLVMATVAGVEAVRRGSRRVPGVFAASIGVMLVSSFAVTSYGLLVVLDIPGPWYTPQYAVPLLGMVLGNMLNGISLGLEASLEGFARERDRIELLLAHGATRREAARRGLAPVLAVSLGANALHWLPSGNLSGFLISTVPIIGALGYAYVAMLSNHRLHRGIVAETERVVGNDSRLLESLVDHPLHRLDARLSDQRLAAEVIGSYRRS